MPELTLGRDIRAARMPDCLAGWLALWVIYSIAFNRFLCKLETNVNSPNKFTDTHTDPHSYSQIDTDTDTATQISKFQVEAKEICFFFFFFLFFWSRSAKTFTHFNEAKTFEQTAKKIRKGEQVSSGNTDCLMPAYGTDYKSIV